MARPCDFCLCLSYAWAREPKPTPLIFHVICFFRGHVPGIAVRNDGQLDPRCMRCAREL